MEYAGILELQYRQQYHVNIAVVPLVIWAIAGKTPAPIYHLERFGKVLCHREYFELHLPRMDWHDVDPLLLVLAPYLQGVKREDLETIALKLYAAAPAGKQATVLGAFLALGERRYANFAEIEQAILQKVREQMNEILQAIEESSFGVAIMEKGRIEGKLEGKLEGKAEAVQILWQSRFGAMPEEVTAAVQHLSETQLQEVLALFASAPTEAQVRVKLGR
jgi:hypothetical protein